MAKINTPKSTVDTSTISIPNLNIGREYDAKDVNSDIHYERLEALADFFGRNMPVHHHARFYQIHLIVNGKVRIHLDETNYTVDGPMFFLTPPSTPHSFVFEEDTKGHVLTVRQNVVWELLNGSTQQEWKNNSFLENPLCMSLSIQTNSVAARLLKTFDVISEECQINDNYHEPALTALLKLTLIHIARLAEQNTTQNKAKSSKEFIRIFHKFNLLIEENFKQHLPLLFYTNDIGVTEARLNTICRQLAGLSSKNLINERLMQEARRLLHFTSSSVTEITYELGFKDTAYFARFFRRHNGVTASEYREQKSKQCLSKNDLS